MRLRIGTFNVWGLPKPFSDDVSARLRAIAARLPGLDLDLLLIQEAWTDEVRDNLQAAAVASGWRVAAEEDATGGGLMALSRLPIRSAEFERFRFRGDPERFDKGEFLGGKGFQLLTLEGDDHPIRVINTHLHARYRRHHPRLNSAVRLAQLIQVIRTLDELEGPVVVGGDFNFSPGEAEYDVFRGLTGAIEVAEGRRGLATLSRSNFYKRGRTGADKRIDLIFVRPAPGVPWRADHPRVFFAESPRIRGRDRSLSDHFGFAAQLDLSSPGDLATSPGVASRPDPAALRLARGLIDLGRREALRRERLHLSHAGTWVAGAALAMGVKGHPVIQRRAFLRGSVGAFALGALAPAFGYTTLARFDSAHKHDAFDDAQEVLAHLESSSRGAA